MEGVNDSRNTAFQLLSKIKQSVTVDKMAELTLACNDLPETVKILSRYSDGKAYHLLLEKYELDDMQLQLEIAMDFMLDTICFAAKQGLAWKKVLITFHLICDVLIEISNQDLPLDKALAAYRVKVGELQNRFSDKFLLSLFRFHIESVFCQYNLVKYCLTQKRTLNLVKDSLVVYPATHVPSLDEGYTPEKWSLLQKCKDIEAKYEARLEDERSKYVSGINAVDLKEKKALSEANNYAGNDAKFELQENINSLVQDLAVVQANLVETEIVTNAEQSKILLEKNVELLSISNTTSN